MCFTLDHRSAPSLVPIALLLWVACSQSRSSETGELRWTTYAAHASSILISRCADCHSGTNGQGGYAVDSYLAVVARRDDGTPRVAAGDPNSMLLAAAQGKLAGHPPIVSITSDDLAVLTDWVVRSRLAPKQYTVHFKGWMDPGNFTEFHGRVLRGTGYAFDNCIQCHGQDLRGGITGIDCNSCHARGVLACNTCHGDAVSPAPPRDLDGIRVVTSIGVGAHRAHVLNGSIHVAYNCTRCHQLSDNHYANAGQPNARPVNVTLASTPSATAIWDRMNATCANSYCHNPLTSDTSATHAAFRWTAPRTEAPACNTCHGYPPSSHSDSSSNCQTCHQQSYVGGVFSPRLHANGVLELGNNGSGCSGCHGDSTSPAPPNDVLGRTDEHLQTIGAHRAHLEARHLLSRPIDCAECHAVPTDIHSPGHIDHAPPAIVFQPAGVLAQTDGAQPRYNPANASCGSVYCHAGGNRDASDLTPGIIRMPSWTGGTSQAACGACHGIPPVNAAHMGVGGITECVNCHSPTIDATGALKVTRDPVTGEIHSTHINGIVDFGGP